MKKQAEKSYNPKYLSPTQHSPEWGSDLCMNEHNELVHAAQIGDGTGFMVTASKSG